MGGLDHDLHAVTMSRKKFTEEDGSPIRPWEEKDDFKEGHHLHGKPIGTILAPRDMEDNEITEEMVDQKPVRPDSIPTVTMKPHIAALLGHGYNVGALALAQIEKRLRSNEVFDNDMALRYHKVIDSVTKLSREERAQEDAVAPEEMSDEELVEYIEVQIEKGVLSPGSD